MAIPESPAVKDPKRQRSAVDFAELERRSKAVKQMDVYTGEIITKDSTTHTQS